MRRGFTMVETMVAAAIGVIVLTAVASSFMAAQRMLHAAMAESELSLAMREMRDKLLFKESPDISGNHYGGLLSGCELNEGEAQNRSSVEMSGQTVGATLSNTNSSSLRLLVWQVAGENGNWQMMINERTPDKDAHVGWLWAGSQSLVNWDDPESDNIAMSDILDYASRNSSGSNIYRLDFNVAMTVKRRDGSNFLNPDGSRIVRREKVSVPVLGKLQPLRDARGRY